MTEVHHGLEGVVAFETEIAEPDKEGSALRYRGVDIEEIVGRIPFEKVWGLLIDGKFEPEHPELLVYSPDANGKLQLVAVEYAVPLAASAHAPEGFEGSADTWVPDVQFPLWTLHAWVWSPNPAGIFNPMNSRVP